MNVHDIVKQKNAFQCLDCAVCSASCPISRRNPKFSPRLMVRRAIYGDGDRVLDDPELWSCLTCGTCDSRCPFDVDYTGLVKSMRAESLRAGWQGVPSHDGLMQTLMEIMAKGAMQNRVGWITDEFETSEKGEHLLFVGCLPYHEIAFESYGIPLLKIARDSLTLLHKTGVRPIVSNDERCCGHDLLWEGDVDTFKALAALNLEMIEKAGAKEVIFICPECYYTFREEYPKYLGDLGFKPVHIVEYLAERLNGLNFKESDRILTYHDSCRLGRFSGVYDSPRQIIAAIPGAKLVEMDRNREDSLCCGATGWTNCFNCSKKIQTERLLEAQSTGANLLITGCHKCQIHFRCAMMGGTPEMKMMDIVSLVAESLR